MDVTALIDHLIRFYVAMHQLREVKGDERVKLRFLTNLYMTQLRHIFQLADVKSSVGVVLEGAFPQQVKDAINELLGENVMSPDEAQIIESLNRGSETRH